MFSCLASAMLWEWERPAAEQAAGESLPLGTGSRDSTRGCLYRYIHMPVYVFRNILRIYLCVYVCMCTFTRISGLP